MVPELLELRISDSLVNKRCHLQEALHGISSYGFTRYTVPLQNFLHHPSVSQQSPSPLAGEGWGEGVRLKGAVAN